MTTHHDPPRKRLVVLAGPHKSASTSTQSFFLNLASDSPSAYKKKAFENWTWPWFDIQNLGKKVPSDKVLSMLVTKRHDEPLKSEILKVLSDLWKNNSNLVLGTEEFDRFGATPLTKRDGIGRPIKSMVDLLQSALQDLETVDMYCIDHLGIRNGFSKILDYNMYLFTIFRSTFKK